MIDNIIYNLDSIDLEDFLKNSYEKIWDSIEKEGYSRCTKKWRFFYI